MKKFFIVLVIALTLICGSIAYAAVIPTEVILNQNIAITYNGKVQRFKNAKGEMVYPISYEGTTYLPIRSISCLFETEIKWDGNTNSIYLGKGSLDTIAAESISEFVSGKNENVMVNINQDIKLYYNDEVQTFKDANGKVVYPLSYQGTTYLPVRAISNLYNANIEWNGETKTVAITKNDNNVAESNIKTDNFKITGYAKYNDIVDFYIHNEELEKDITIKASDFNLPICLCDYSEDILLKITYSAQDYKVHSCVVLNALTSEKITDLSEENIKRLFDIEYGKTIIDKAWTQKINLSELSPNEIYRYTATETTQTPEIINDTGKDCFIYQKDSKSIFSENYEREINLYNNIKGNEVLLSYDEFAQGETLIIMYKPISTIEILTQIDEVDIVRLSKYKAGEELSYKFEEYIYNDTSNNISIVTKNEVFGEVFEETIEVEAGRIYGFSWMIDSVTIK